MFQDRIRRSSGNTASVHSASRPLRLRHAESVTSSIDPPAPGSIFSILQPASLLSSPPPAPFSATPSSSPQLHQPQSAPFSTTPIDCMPTRLRSMVNNDATPPPPPTDPAILRCLDEHDTIASLQAVILHMDAKINSLLAGRPITFVMFNAVSPSIPVLYLLQKYLGEYIELLFDEALSVWKGEIVSKDLRLKAGELILLNLPVTIKGVFIDTITTQVPWKSLGKGPVIILIDNIFVLAEPAPDGHTLKDEDKEKLFESHLKQMQAPREWSWLDSLYATIFGDFKVTINNLHIRYEDSISNPGHPFCSGVTLSKLVFTTTDEQDNETFDASGALDKLRELVLMGEDQTSLSTSSPLCSNVFNLFAT